MEDRMRNWFFVVGAQKAGTSTLHRWLRIQNNIRLPDVKEIGFFASDKLYANDEEWYLNFYKSTSPVNMYGEVNPEYLYNKYVAKRIRKFRTNAKIIIILRNPLERAYSQYAMSVRRGLEQKTFEGALNSEDQRLSSGDLFPFLHFSYFSRSNYLPHLERYSQLFPEHQLSIHFFEHLFDARTGKEEFSRLCDFIGVRKGAAVFDPKERLNPSRRLLFPKLFGFLYGGSNLKKTLGHLIPSEKWKIRIYESFEKSMTRKQEHDNWAEHFSLSENNTEKFQIIYDDVASFLDREPPWTKE